MLKKRVLFGQLMAGFKDFLLFLIGLILIIGGFLSFILIPASSQIGIDVEYTFLTSLGCFLIFLGSVLMYMFLKTENKKKKTKKQ
jgi:hypothetical protein